MKTFEEQLRHDCPALARHEQDLFGLDEQGGQPMQGQAPPMAIPVQQGQPQMQQQQVPVAQANFAQMFMTLLGDLENLKKASVKLNRDADTIVQGTKRDNTAQNQILRRMSREVREAGDKIEELVVHAAQGIKNLAQQQPGGGGQQRPQQGGRQPAMW